MVGAIHVGTVSKSTMNKILAVLASAVIAVSVIAGEFPDVSIKEVAKLADNKAAVIIDVNGSESYNKGHVPGALDFEAIKGDFAKSLPADKNATMVAYCGGPKFMAYQAAAPEAAKLGYKNVKHMSAGIAGWKEAGQKLEIARK